MLVEILHDVERVLTNLKINGVNSNFCRPARACLRIPVSLKRRTLKQQDDLGFKIRDDKSGHDDIHPDLDGFGTLDTKKQQTDGNLHETHTREQEDLSDQSAFDDPGILFGCEVPDVSTIAIGVQDYEYDRPSGCKEGGQQDGPVVPADMTACSPNPQSQDGGDDGDKS